VGPHRAYDHRFGNARDAIAVNAVRRGELYSKYTYYHSYYTPKEEDSRDHLDDDAESVPASGNDSSSKTD
jgi:hypothetical protein